MIISFKTDNKNTETNKDTINLLKNIEINENMLSLSKEAIINNNIDFKSLTKNNDVFNINNKIIVVDKIFSKDFIKIFNKSIKIYYNDLYKGLLLLCTRFDNKISINLNFIDNHLKEQFYSELNFFIVKVITGKDYKEEFVYSNNKESIRNDVIDFVDNNKNFLNSKVYKIEFYDKYQNILFSEYTNIVKKEIENFSVNFINNFNIEFNDNKNILVKFPPKIYNSKKIYYELYMSAINDYEYIYNSGFNLDFINIFSTKNIDQQDLNINFDYKIQLPIDDSDRFLFFKIRCFDENNNYGNDSYIKIFDLTNIKYNNNFDITKIINKSMTIRGLK